MLNRLFVIIGVLVICGIVGAFFVPRFITWGDYRGRLQTMATQAFGADVAIDGDIELTLLPQPQLVFTKVRVGPAAAPIASVDKVEAQFSLLDFLRDRYQVTSLTLDHPQVNFAIGADGTFAAGIAVARANAAQSNVSIANATVVDGTAQLADARTSQTYAANHINGQLRLDALDGPFSFQGALTYGGASYGTRVSAGKVGNDGSTTTSLYLKPNDNTFTLDTSGALQLGTAPKYTGDLTFRLPPPKPATGDTVDAGRGDFVLTAKVAAASDKLTLTDYTALPDENRSATRLTGAAEVMLGKSVSFKAVVSGGVVALPPRDATKELTDPPYELVRLLGETPLPPVPAIPGTVNMDITELNLRAVALRELTLDATTDAKSWSIKDFAATLPGGAKLGLTGELTAAAGKPVFAGTVSLDTDHLDLFANLYRRPPSDNPLFGLAGSLKADVALAGDTLTFSNGSLRVGDATQAIDGEIGFSPAARELKLDAHFTALDDKQSAAIGALLPDVTGNGSFGATFPKGEIDLSASKATLFGLDGQDLAATASWEGGVLEFSKLSAGNLGGATFDANLTAFGTLQKPELSGTGTLNLADGAPAVGKVLGSLAAPPAIADFLRRSLPANLNLDLAAPAADGGQTLTAIGKLGTADAKLTAKLGAGIVSALSAPITADLDMSSPTPQAMQAQLGLGDLPLFAEGTPLHLAVSVDGVPDKSYQTHVALSGGDNHIEFSGAVDPGDLTHIKGEGPLDVRLGDPSGLVAALGAGGIWVPEIAGTADLKFDGLDQLALSDIKAGGVTGALALGHAGDTTQVSGSLNLPATDARALLPLFAGSASTITDRGPWPDGPIDIGSKPRSTEGRIDVSIASIDNAGVPIITNAKFGLDWDAQSVKLRNLTGALGTGSFGLDAEVCCSNSLSGKQVSGRLSLSGVPLATIAPGPVAEALAANVDASVAFDGTGATLAEAVQAMTGTGSYTLKDFSAARFDPGVFKSAAAIPDVVNVEPDALTTAVTDKLSDAPFAAPSVTGSFTIAGGVLRNPNVAVDSGDARIFGGGNLALDDLTLDARYAMTPTGSIDPNSTIDPTSAEVAAVVKGPLASPSVGYDVASLVEGMKIKASEIELAVLEQRKAEADARAKAAVQLAILQSGQRLAIAGAATKVAQDAAARQAAEAAAAQKAAAAAAAQQKASSASPAPMDLGM